MARLASASRAPASVPEKKHARSKKAAQTEPDDLPDIAELLAASSIQGDRDSISDDEEEDEKPRVAVQKSRRRPLGQLKSDNALLLPLAPSATKSANSRQERRPRAEYRETVVDSESEAEAASVASDSSYDSLADFIVDSSEDEEEDIWTTRRARKKQVQLRRSRPSSSSLDQPFSTLRFSPPRYKAPTTDRDSPTKGITDGKVSTPPRNVPKERPQLASPSKNRFHIPPSPHRQSTNAFWRQSLTNEWNDVHSPKKETSPRRRLFAEEDGVSDTISRRAQSSRKLAFDRVKHSKAEEFLRQLDETVTRGRLAELAANTGGIKVVWSVKLNSTAGRAHWRKERRRVGGGSASEEEIRHIASIELAEKVIDDEARLLSTLAHEFCHLATFMIDGVSKNPHGRLFQAWGRRCNQAFPNVNVTTKHSYAISYKYIWHCDACGIQYKRHSKSINVARQRCGHCKGSLRQVKPAPRKPQQQQGCKPADAAPPYAQFVKTNFAAVKRQNPGSPHKQVMTLLGEQWRREKNKELAGSPSGLKLSIY